MCCVVFVLCCFVLFCVCSLCGGATPSCRRSRNICRHHTMQISGTTARADTFQHAAHRPVPRCTPQARRWCHGRSTWFQHTRCGFSPFLLWSMSLSHSRSRSLSLFSISLSSLSLLSLALSPLSSLSTLSLLSFSLSLSSLTLWLKGHAVEQHAVDSPHRKRATTPEPTWARMASAKMATEQAGGRLGLVADGPCAGHGLVMGRSWAGHGQILGKLS